MRLDEAVSAMFETALDLYRDSPRATKWLSHHAQRFEDPLRIAVAGPPRSGKSTLINAIVGEEIAPIEVEDGNQVFTWYQDGPTPRATVYSPDGTVGELPISRLSRRLRLMGDRPAEDVREVVVDWPTRALRHAILIDTPGIAASAAEVWREADAVLYLTRNVPGMDLDFLRLGQENPIARAAPIGTILVLSRADEVGGGRIDALASARQIARRYRRDIQVRGLCQTVIAMAGLIAQAGRTLREAEFEALAALAARPQAELADHLLSADRFAALDDVGLLDRLGLHGVRVAISLIRTGCATQSALTAQLVQRSGLTELREAISQLLVDRRHVLKARSALLALDFVVRMEPRPGAPRLLVELERAVASAHDFQELRLLAALGSGRTRLPEELTEEACRLVGGTGGDPAVRLGLAEDGADPAELWARGTDAVARWREHAASPLFNQDQRRAARTVVRSCEGLLADLASAPSPVGGHHR